MPRRKLKDDQCEILVRIDKDIRLGLRRIRERTGLTQSQQVRQSLSMWVRRYADKPAEAMDVVTGTALAGTGKPLQPWQVQAEPLGPEPDQQADPVAWSKWSAKQGNLMVAKLAKGEWPE